MTSKQSDVSSSSQMFEATNSIMATTDNVMHYDSNLGIAGKNHATIDKRFEKRTNSTPNKLPKSQANVSAVLSAKEKVLYCVTDYIQL